MYPVFRIDICFSSYATDYILVGAKDKDDLIKHLKDVISDNDLYGGSIDDIISSEKSRFKRIDEIKHMLTDIPYTIIDSYSYYE